MSFVSARGEDWTPPPAPIAVEAPGEVPVNCRKCGWGNSPGHQCGRGMGRPSGSKKRRKTPEPSGDWVPTLTPPTGYARPLVSPERTPPSSEIHPPAPSPCPQCGEPGGYHDPTRHSSPEPERDRQPKRKPPRAEIGRPFLLDELGDVCYFCGDLLDAFSITREHLTPTSRGGTTEEINVVAACRACNGAKGNQTEDEFRAWLLRVIANYLTDDDLRH